MKRGQIMNEISAADLKLGDFAYTGGVLVSIGVEDFEIWPNQSVMLVRRNPHPPR